MAREMSDIPEGSKAPVVVNSRNDVEPELREFLDQSKTAMERLAGGKSLDPILEKLHESLDLLASSPDQSVLNNWFEDVGRYLRRALNDPGWVLSLQAHVAASDLYDRAQQILQSKEHSDWVQKFKSAFSEVETFFKALENDKSTKRLAYALENLLSNTRYMFAIGLGLGGKAQEELKREIRQDIFAWIIPRLLRFIRSIPMPRVEYASPKLEIVIDSLVLTAASSSLFPDHVYVQMIEEISLDTPEEAINYSDSPSNISTTSFSSRFHIDGMRIAAKGISYYINYKGLGFLGWKDNGLLDVYIGKGRIKGQGLSLDVDLDTSLDPENHSLFRTKKAKLDIPGLRFKIRQSRHWIVNKLLQPFAGPSLRRVLAWVLSNQIHQLLDVVDKRMFRIHQRAHETASGIGESPSLGDYWAATLEEFVDDKDEEDEDHKEDEEDEDSTEPPVVHESQTFTSLTGLVHTSTTQATSPSGPPQPPETTTIAIGAGEQILPGKGGPVLEGENPGDVVRDTVIEVEQNVEQGKRSLGDAVREADETRKEVGHAQVVMERTRKKEIKTGGWRSNAFDI